MFFNRVTLSQKIVDSSHVKSGRSTAGHCLCNFAMFEFEIATGLADYFFEKVICKS